MHWTYNEFGCALSTPVQQSCNNRPAIVELVKPQVRNAVSNPHAVGPEHTRSLTYVGSLQVAYQ